MTTEPDGTPWQCTFADEFGGKLLDTRKWLDHPFELVLNMGVDKTTGSNAVFSATVLPATLEVDHVGAWR